MEDIQSVVDLLKAHEAKCETRDAVIDEKFSNLEKGQKRLETSIKAHETKCETRDAVVDEKFSNLEKGQKRLETSIYKVSEDVHRMNNIFLIAAGLLVTVVVGAVSVIGVAAALNFFG